jgi:hypothetical protein
MMTPMALPSAVISRVRLADCAVKYSRGHDVDLEPRVVVKAALKASNAPGAASLTVTDVALLPRR